MKAALLTLGGISSATENLSKALLEQGFETVHLSAASASSLGKALNYALLNSDSVILTAPLGGLGDMRVREALSRFLGQSLRQSGRAQRKIEEYCVQNNVDAAEFSQFAMFPAKSRAILGSGYICGCLCAVDEKPLFVLPQENDEILLSTCIDLLLSYRDAAENGDKTPKAEESTCRMHPKRQGVKIRLIAVLSLVCIAVLCLVIWKISAAEQSKNTASKADIRAALLTPEEILNLDFYEDDNPEHGGGGTDMQDTDETESGTDDETADEDSSVPVITVNVSETPSAASVTQPEEPKSSVSEASSDEPKISSEPASVEEEPSSDAESESETESESEEESVSEEEDEFSSEPEEEDEQDYDYDETLSVRVNGKVIEDDAYTLMCQIITNEIGTSFDIEAIKAQTVAAYTFIKFNNSAGISPSVGLKSCSSDKVKNAVADVLGEAVYYNGKYANTVYHSISAGETTSAAEVWGGNYPYLVSVDSEWDESVSGYQKTYSISAESFANRVESVYGIDLYDYSDNPDDWVEIESYNSGGYVGVVSLGGTTTGKSGSSYGKKTITGRSIRETLLSYKLRSHCFDVSYDDSSDELIFRTYGYGHGVGMSQWGAQMMALEGYDYIEILTHYYTGVTVK